MLIGLAVTPQLLGQAFGVGGRVSMGAAILAWVGDCASVLSKCVKALPATAFFGALAWSLCLGSASAQAQSQIRYTYDAAGNLVQVTRSVVPPKPDLTVSNLSVGTISVNGNGSFNVPVTFQVNNVGVAAAVATWYDRGYVSANAVLHDSDQLLGGYNTRSTDLAAGSSYTVSATFTTTTSTTAGNYTLIVKADGGASASGQYSPTGVSYVAESDETNNTQSVAITLPNRSLVIDAASATNATIVNAGESARFTFAASAGQNLGMGISTLVLAPTSASYANVYVYKPDASLLSSQNCYTAAANGPGCRLALNNVAAGNYSVVVAPVNGATGSFSIQLNSDVTWTLALNTALPVSLKSGQNARLSFTGSVNQSAALQFAQVTTNPTARTLYALVYRPTDTVAVNSSNNFVGYWTYVAIPNTGATLTLPALPAAGTYQVVLQGLYQETSSVSVTRTP